MNARFPNGIETRFVTEIRTTGRTLHGIAAPFDTPADISGMFSETIKPGAFTGSLSRDVVATADHDPARLLGRTRSGTLRLSESRAGLEYSLDVPNTGLGNDLLAHAQRGDLGGVSIGFIATDETWPNNRSRVLTGIELHEVSIITGGTPAYAGTSVAMRNRNMREYGAHDRRGRVLELQLVALARGAR